MKTISLANGLTIPSIGFGTFLIPDGKEVSNAVSTAIGCGYTHIDTAAAYNNEAGVGEGIRQSGIKREDLFLVSKVWNSEQTYGKTMAAFETSLNKLGTDYLDLYLIHWPKDESGECWRAMEELYRGGRVKSIGVCNFNPHHFDELLKDAEIAPMINQVELHPQFPQEDLRAWCRERNILMESWGPLMQGQVFSIPLMRELAQKYDKTVAQIAIRWQMELGLVSLVKSVKRERMELNRDVFGFELDPADLELMKGLSGERIGPDPDNFDF